MNRKESPHLVEPSTPRGESLGGQSAIQSVCCMSRQKRKLSKTKKIAPVATKSSPEPFSGLLIPSKIDGYRGSTRDA
jgi:hypothetical protein